MTNVKLKTDIGMLAGVGPDKAQALKALGVNTAADLLEYFPRDWEFLPELCPIDELCAGANVTVAGFVESIDYQVRRRKPVYEIYLTDASRARCRVIWFNGGYLRNQIQLGMQIAVVGKVSKYKNQLQFTNPKFRVITSQEMENIRELGGAVYPASASISSPMLKYIFRRNIDSLVPLLDEYFGEEFRAQKQLMARSVAYRQIHRPSDEQSLSAARRTIKYEELFLMQLGLAIRRYRMRNFAPSIAMRFSRALDERIRRRFPFLLTPEQDGAVHDIVMDMIQPKPMNRLLQGDVGSGKTAVAVYAALLAIANKTQVAMMAPTEILARQHSASVNRFLEGSRVRVELLTGKMNATERKRIIEATEAGEVDFLVGTVALIQSDVQFKNLGLAIIDEQHKFGVEQRGVLRKDSAPHCLVMTATPIPRTMTMTVFGDLDVSTIKGAPPGRGKVTTRNVSPENRGKAMEFIRSLVRAGRQAYFVYPRIDSDGESDMKSAVEEYELLKKYVFAEFNVALLHGQMKQAEKQAVMAAFRSGEVNILVSTVVIEVGVDVPNATVMVIENANNFGLAQLHQLRGRIGRGRSDSYCLLFSESGTEDALRRLEVMEKSNDGFVIAEKDLEIRGPGELFSTRQHGLPDLKLANIIEDFDLLSMARRDAIELITHDPYLGAPKNVALRRAIISKFGDKLGLTDIA
ncbi:MAG: ATP-dependent DNA helicase RecG [Phycisphaerae bacterium]